MIVAPDPERPGNYLGTIDIPRQALAGEALEAVVFQPGEHLEFALAAPGTPRWIGHYNEDGSIVCQFSQAELTRPCSLRELSERLVVPPEPPRRAQTPLPPFPYTIERVRYENPVAQLMLAGTLSVPAGEGPHPAVLIVGDLGPGDRDGARFRHKPWLVLADHLTRAGVAVLRVDARGVGGSDAGPPDAGAMDLESDVQAGLAFLRGVGGIDSGHLGLIAHGFGAIVAAQAAPSVDFVVLLAAPAVPGREVLARRSQLGALAAGATPEQAQLALEQSRAASESLAAESEPARRRELLKALFAEGSEDPKASRGALGLDDWLELAEAPGARDFIQADPTPLLRSMPCPVLALVAERDQEVDPAQSAAQLRAALTATASASVESLSGLNHRFQSAETGATAEYEKIEETFAPAALERITSWIQETTRR